MLAETVVFNSNLTYVTKLFMEQTTTKDEKQGILKRFDEEDFKDWDTYKEQTCFCAYFYGKMSYFLNKGFTVVEFYDFDLT